MLQFTTNIAKMNNTSQIWENATSIPDHHKTDEQLIFSLITVEMYTSFTWIINTVVMPTLCGVSIIGNVLGLGLLWKLKRDNIVSIYTYLCALTLTDILYLFLGLVRQIPYFLKYVDEQLANYVGVHTRVVVVFLDQVLFHTSTAIIVVMSIERFIALVRPLKVKNTHFAKHPYKIILLLYILNTISATPLVVLIESVAVVNENNITEYYVRSRSLYAIKIVLIWQTIVDFLVPVIILLCTNTGIAIAYSRIIKIRQTTLTMDSDSVGSQQKKVTFTVFCITTLFLFLSIPDMIIKIVAFVDTEYSWEGNFKHVYWFFQELTNLMSYINAGNDFVVYVLVSDRCRKLFKEMYCGCCFLKSAREETNNTFSNVHSISGDTINS